MPGQTLLTWDDYVPKSLSYTCGWCRRDVEATRVSTPVEIDTRDQPQGQKIVRLGSKFVCPRSECGRPSLVFLRVRTRVTERPIFEGILGQLPRGMPPPMEGLSDAIDSVRSEAWSCFHGGDFRAAVVMGRAAVQRAVRSLGGEGRDLYQEIDSLHAQEIVTKALKDWAHEVRLAGNDAAHPEELEEVSEDEAEESLTFMDDFLNFAVALPQRHADRKAARERLAADE